MSVEIRLDTIASHLALYQQQMCALSEALDALKQVADVISSGLVTSSAECSELSLAMNAKAVPAWNQAATTSTTTCDAEEGMLAAMRFAAEELATEQAAEEHYEGLWSLGATSEPNTNVCELGSEFAGTCGHDYDLCQAAAEAGIDSSSLWHRATGPDEPTATGEIRPEGVVLALGEEKPAAEVAISENGGTEKSPIETDSQSGRQELEIGGSNASIPTDAATASGSADKASDGKVIDLSLRRVTLQGFPQRSFRRRSTGFLVAMFVAAIGTILFQELLQSEVAQQVFQMGSCDANATATARDCATVAWLYF